MRKHKKSVYVQVGKARGFGKISKGGCLACSSLVRSNYANVIQSCEECLRLHGGVPVHASHTGPFDFLPTAYVKDVSSAYCAQKTATVVWVEYASNYTLSHPMSVGTETGGADLLKSKTAVSNYFTETSGNSSMISTGTPSAGTGSSSQAPLAIKPSSTTESSASGAAAAAASSTGGANTLHMSACLVAGLLGVTWLL